MNNYPKEINVFHFRVETLFRVHKLHPAAPEAASKKNVYTRFRTS
jgi:hypothetical protein